MTGSFDRVMSACFKLAVYTVGLELNWGWTEYWGLLQLGGQTTEQQHMLLIRLQAGHTACKNLYPLLYTTGNLAHTLVWAYRPKLLS